MKAERDGDDDLLVLARRGDLPESEQRRLRDALAASAETRLLYEAGRAFDMEAPVLAGDDERVERIERQVLALREQGSWGVWRARRLVQGVAAAVLIAGAAVGGVELSRSSGAPKGVDLSPSVAPGSEGAPGAARPPSAGRAADLPLAATLEPSAVAPPAAPEPAPVPRHPDTRLAPRPVEQPSAAPPAPRAATAQELFLAANLARVRGDTLGAIALSQRLEELFPQSSEARTARLSLGVLYLQQGKPALSLEQFRTYRTPGGGVSTPEALWGEAEALHQLGRASEERAALDELLRGYPQSAYSAAAQKRLAAPP